MYDACGKAKAAKVKTTTSTVQMTSGCAVFILMTPTERRGKSIIVVRKHTRWQTFARENSIELQRFVDAKAKTWKKYKFRQQNGSCRFWWFNLCGKLSYDEACASDEIMSTATADIQFRQSHWNKEYYFKGEHVV